ncbi:YcaO-like family protein [Saliphagus infecundisoli]|uniref:YcaO-like family protein n=1 Tax=Saliphagus infecundisoli TaxID=1849069 RepID=A0ABD5QFU8_9EURY|nr:YcaO-like family protein [Saliphagus infecundisoli]
MDVHIVGGDPVREAVVAALEDVEVRVREGDPAGVAEADLAVVAARSGSGTLERANEAAMAGGTPWIAVEVGGVGGSGGVDAAVAGFPGIEPGCYDCLRTRVESTSGDPGGEEDGETSADAPEGAETPEVPRHVARLAGAVAGREFVSLLEDDDRSIMGQVVELPHARRRLLPVPGCECGRERERDLGRDDDSLGVEAAVSRAEAAIDDRVGIVSTIGEVESFPAPYYLATIADTTAFSDAAAPTNAAGVAEDWNPAMMKAVGEALERYCAGVYRETDFHHAPPADLGRAVSPTDLVRPDSAPEIDPDAERRWVAGEELSTGESAYLPAAAVQFPQPGKRLVPAITTGLGLGSSTVGALLAGLTETIERDAAMLSWYSTYEPLELAVDDEGFEALAGRARGEGLSVTPLLVTQDVDVPVVACAVSREGEWPRFAIGSAAGLDANAAARGALEEAIQNWMELRSMGEEGSDAASGAIGEYADFPERVREFLDCEGRVPADSVGPDPVPEGSEALDAVVSRVEASGLTPYAARITTPDVADLGFEAVRVVVPGAQPLFTGEPFFGERAGTVPESLGFEPRLDREFHPYP